MLARLRAALADVAQAHATQLSPLPLRAKLLSFAEERDLARWIITSDKCIGGFSEATLCRASASAASFRGATKLKSDPSRQALYMSDQGKQASKTGFCAIRTTVSCESWPTLYDFHGVCIRMRPDRRSYIVNIRAETVLGDERMDDLYQAATGPFVAHAMATAAAEKGARQGGERQAMIDIRVPWGAFSLSWRGHVQGPRPPAMNLQKITHIGLLIADGKDGEFHCDFESISAFRYNEEEMYRDPFVMDAMELNVDRGYETAQNL